MLSVFPKPYNLNKVIKQQNLISTNQLEQKPAFLKEMHALLHKGTIQECVKHILIV